MSNLPRTLQINEPALSIRDPLVPFISAEFYGWTEGGSSSNYLCVCACCLKLDDSSLMSALFFMAAISKNKLLTRDNLEKRRKVDD
jgi:hypothetical protein